MKNIPWQKIWTLIRSHLWLRVSLILSALFLIATVFMIFKGLGYRDAIAANQHQISDNQSKYTSLQQIVDSQGHDPKSSSGLFSKKAFADFDEVIPFISYLEAVFTPIDPKAEFTITSGEDQIVQNHTADYHVQLHNIKGQMNKLYRSLDEVYNSRFVASIISFRTDYQANDVNGDNVMDDMEFVIRLYLK